MPRTLRGLLFYGLAGVAVAACDSGPSQIIPGVNCANSTAVTLSPGQSLVLDATVNLGCIRIPAAGPGGAQHLIVAYSAAGQETQNGISGPYSLNSQGVTSASSPAPVSSLSLPVPNLAAQFEANLRRREVELSRNPGLRSPTRAPVRAIPPVFGSQRSFKVCATANCTTFVNVTATAKFVGPRGAIFLDDTVPAGGYSQSDIDSLGAIFDGPSPNMYEIDTTSFGRESDLDANGVVIILLSDAINNLSGNCNQTNQVILGYFFGLDLVSDPNSNHGEIFYSMVPNPNGATCTIPKSYAENHLPPTFIHEFQHMISFNQHFLMRGGQAEQTWLNEGLSHFAEELGGRELPSSRCPAFASCLDQFAVGDLSNGFTYLKAVESFFLISPGSSFGTLPERGAEWLFVRWLADQEAADTILGIDLTRALLATSQLGSANVEAVTGQSFDHLVGQWQMANYTESLAGFSDPTGRLRYKSWDLDAAFAAASGGLPYPLVPDQTSGPYSRTNTLRAGSGRHLLVNQSAGAGAIDLQFKGDQTFKSLVPRLAIVRIQ